MNYLHLIALNLWLLMTPGIYAQQQDTTKMYHIKEAATVVIGRLKSEYKV